MKSFYIISENNVYSHQLDLFCSKCFLGRRNQRDGNRLLCSTLLCKVTKTKHKMKKKLTFGTEMNNYLSKILLL